MTQPGEDETTTWLEMHAPAELRAPAADTVTLELQHVVDGAAEFGRRMYVDVGTAWHWIDRLPWTPEQWRARYAPDDVQIWSAGINGHEAGYFELEKWNDGSVEIAYFGLLPSHIGCGLGGALLTAATRAAWEFGAQRVWVHTSNRDHASALPNYLARGFRVYRSETRPTPLAPPAGHEAG